MATETAAPNTAIPKTAIEWAKKHGQPFSYRAPLDAYEPPRKETFGRGWTYVHPDSAVGTGIILEGAIGRFRDAHQAVYLVDDGEAVKPFYVAAWHGELDYVILQPFPTGPAYRTWMVGASRCYHLKVQP